MEREKGFDESLSERRYRISKVMSVDKIHLEMRGAWRGGRRSPTLVLSGFAGVRVLHLFDLLL